MRVLVKLENKEHMGYEIPINYQYPLSSAVYKLMSKASPDFTEWLHKIGYKHSNGKPYKMFTFSKLQTNHIDKEKLKKGVLSSSGELKFCFSSAVDENITLSLVKGILNIGEISIGAKGIPATDFLIKEVIAMREPEFTNKVSYKMLSPTCVSVHNGKSVEFLSANDESTFKRLEDNLKRKYQVLYNKDYTNELEIKPVDPNQFKNKKITIKENTDEEGHIRAFETHINIKASPEMQKLAYDVGIGERNSMGFGMIEIIGVEK